MTLPITNYKEAIIEAVKNHYVTIITAETGSGKTTQVPQYLAEYYDVTLTEPRIMAAKTGAKRVADEMGVELGEEVGYATGYDKCFSKNTKILFCTDGLQMTRTILSRNKDRENVLIIDEVHEWNINIETLIAYCKYMQGNWKTKIVIMSATMEAEALSQFFGEDAIILKVPGTLYEVEVQQRRERDLVPSIKQAIQAMKNSLVFVPGKREMSNVIEELKEERAVVLPLHGELDWEEQRKCFGQYSYPKVIVATNVAQTSVTIPDIDVVIDTGKARITIAEDGIQGLFLRDISQADIWQRKGRAGRTKSGKYILCSDTPIEERPEFSVSEIQRSLLDRVVLQLASTGLAAESLEFYHQPDKQAIVIAKKVLVTLGAMDKQGNVTETGHKMVKMPVSVQLARMIVEAEKYGVTEKVITIAAIIEMGGLLGKRIYREQIDGKWYQQEENVRYSDFTDEKDSDLLAELDVWESINRQGYIDFQGLGIHKKNFFRIKEHLKKLKEALFGIVELENNDDRKAILKSCLVGMITNTYARYSIDEFTKEDDFVRKIDKRSCVRHSMIHPVNFVVGTPKTIEFEDRWGMKVQMHLIHFVSKVESSMLFELVPNQIQEKEELFYVPTENAVKVITTKHFLGREIQTQSYYDYQHPEYSRLKAEYEEELRRQQEIESWRYSWNRDYDEESEDSRQQTVIIGGRSFSITYGWDKKAKVHIDRETLFTTDEKEILLEDGSKVYVSCGFNRRESTNLEELRNALQYEEIREGMERAKRKYAKLRVTTLRDAILQKDRLGKVKLAIDKGGYGENPIYAYACFSLNKNTVTFEVTNDEEVANSKTKEALQNLFMKEVSKKYGESKFSHQQGKKKKVLTDSEKRMKEDFDSLVRECLRDLNCDNVLESMDFLEEYYQELMAK